MDPARLTVATNGIQARVSTPWPWRFALALTETALVGDEEGRSCVMETPDTVRERRLASLLLGLYEIM